MQLDDLRALTELAKLLNLAQHSKGDAGGIVKKTTEALHKASDRFSDAEYPGVSNALALLADLVGPMQTKESPDRPELLANTEACIRQLAYNPSVGVEPLMKCLSDDRWPVPTKIRHVGALRELLSNDMQGLTQNGAIDPAELSDEEVVQLALIKEMHRILAAHTNLDAADAGASEQLVADFHQLSESCSEANLLGYSDLFVLYAEFIKSLGAKGFSLEAKVSQLLHQGLAVLTQRPTYKTVDSVMKILSLKQWPRPLPKDDAGILRSLLRSEIELLAPLFTVASPPKVKSMWEEGDELTSKKKTSAEPTTSAAASPVVEPVAAEPSAAETEQAPVESSLTLETDDSGDAASEPVKAVAEPDVEAVAEAVVETIAETVAEDAAADAAVENDLEFDLTLDESDADLEIAETDYSLSADEGDSDAEASVLGDFGLDLENADLAEANLDSADLDDADLDIMDIDESENLSADSTASTAGYVENVFAEISAHDDEADAAFDTEFDVLAEADEEALVSEDLASEPEDLAATLELADIQPQLKAALAVDDLAELDVSVENIHSLVEHCSENELLGCSDLLVLYAELMQQAETAQPLSSQAGFSDIQSAVNSWADELSGSAINKVLEQLSQPRWQDSISVDDLEFIRPLLIADSQRLCAEVGIDYIEAGAEAASAIDEGEADAGAITDATSEIVEPAVDESGDADEVLAVPELYQQLVAAVRLEADADLDAWVEQIHHLVEACSENELLGFSDLLAFYAEAISHVDTPADNGQCQQLVAAVSALLAAPAVESKVNDVLSALGQDGWSDIVAADDVEFLKPLLIEDGAVLAAYAPALAEAAETAELEEADVAVTEASETELESELIGAADPEPVEAEPEPAKETAKPKKTKATKKTAPEPVDDAKPDFLTINVDLLSEAQPPVDTAVLSMLTDSLGEQSSKWDATQGDPALISEAEMQLDSLSRALGTIGMLGAQAVVDGLLINLAWLSLHPEELTDSNTNAVAAAFSSLQAYLSAVGDKGHREALIDACMHLPCGLTMEQSAFLTGLLALASIQDPKSIERKIATAEEVMLESGREVDPELAGMLNTELPQLSDEFSEQVQSITERQDAEALRDAQRTAHTIKGLANMAGIPGLANLTHYLEDILELLTDEALLPGERLSEDMMDASDCLAQMCDHITANEPEPDRAIECLQRVFDWHYLAKTEGVESLTGDGPVAAQAGAVEDSAAETAVTAESEAAPAQAAKAAKKTSAAAESAVKSVDEPPPAALADDEVEKASDDAQATQSVSVSLLNTLFRIAGESTTLNTQIEEELMQLRRLTRTSRDRYRAMERVMADLEQRLNEFSYQNAALTPGDEKFDALEMDTYNELHTSISRLHEAAADVSEVNSSMNGHIHQLAELQSSQTGLQKETLENIVRTRMVPVSSITSRIQRIVRQACRATGKKANLVVEGEDVMIDSQVLREVTAPLMHIVRNAIDHGLETPHARFEIGKDEVGTLKLSFQRDSDQLLISCEDDGSGIDTARVREAAEQKGLITPDIELSEQETNRLILLPGFSTREETSHLSGRGIGMDIVSQQVDTLHGTLNIYSERGKGARIEMSLPPSSLMVRVVLVRAGQQLVALSTHGIEQNILSIDGTFMERDDELYFDVEGQEYRALSIESLTGKAARPMQPGQVHPVLIVNAGPDEKVAVLVHEVLAHRELIFKEMGDLIPIIPGISGLTILANGQVAPVIDLPARIAHEQSTFNIRTEMTMFEETQQLTKVMVVDDSISARKSLVTLLQDVGYEVQYAIDGLDAMNKIRKDPPDIVLTDYEMPRMNGVELSSSLTRRAETEHIPIIMITSRSTEKHRLEADSAGVNAYITKPWTETQLLSAIDDLLQDKVVAEAV